MKPINSTIWPSHAWIQNFERRQISLESGIALRKMFTIKKVREKTKHVNIWNTIQHSDPSNQELTNKWIEYIHALPQKWDELLNAAPMSSWIHFKALPRKSQAYNKWMWSQLKFLSVWFTWTAPISIVWCQQWRSLDAIHNVHGGQWHTEIIPST